ncbi:hypothetical protein ABI59_12555 [Acidobacteria bacterium Mor1]|nr:hypothetical protein ABI59_12555 [Acidobacteria bacterium Mor1]
MRSTRSNDAILPASLLCGLLAATLAAADGTGRDDDPVVLSGAMLPELMGRDLSELRLYRFDGPPQGFVPVPFQLDERLVKVFDAGEPTEFSEAMYDVFGDEDGTLDADDELVFYFGDAGGQAPPGAVWPTGAEPLRFEIRAQDPRLDDPEPDRYLYLFVGSSLPESTSQYVVWDTTVDGDAAGESFLIEYDDRWILGGLRVSAPCGTGGDLIDRFKGRVTPFPGVFQDEEDWNLTSTYLGGKVGPVRAIRYVRGARSGVNTVHHDIVYRHAWHRRINLRVHELESTSVYFDGLPINGSVLVTSQDLSGVAVDGIPDGAIGAEWVDWVLTRTPAGGSVTLFDVPLSPLYATREFFYRDDASYDDTVPGKTGYGDEDDAAYGAYGFTLLDTLDSNLTPIEVGMQLYPLCSDSGDLTLVADLVARAGAPIDPTPLPQADCGFIRDLQLTRDVDDILLSWGTLPEADSYRVYAAGFPELDSGSWTLLSDGPGNTFRDAMAAGLPDRYYSVVCVDDGGEGPP